MTLAAAPAPGASKRANRLRLIGVDPGLDGGVAVLDGDQLTEVLDMPVLEAKSSKSKGKRLVDPHGLVRLFDRLHAPKLLYGWEVVAYLEHVHASPGMGPAGAFSFGRSLGVVETALAAARIPYTFVDPSVWKPALQVPQAKDGAVSRASQLLPAAAHHFRGPRGGVIDGRAEAALIALYGRKKEAGG